MTREYLAIAMEFAAGGDMFQYVKQRGGLEEVEARWFFQQLIIGMDYCHKMASARSCRLAVRSPLAWVLLVSLVTGKRMCFPHDVDTCLGLARWSRGDVSLEGAVPGRMRTAGPSHSWSGAEASCLAQGAHVGCRGW